jgi:hypothetical protein
VTMLQNPKLKKASHWGTSTWYITFLDKVDVYP